MKFIEPRPLADPDAAARKLVEIANGVEAVQDLALHRGAKRPRGRRSRKLEPSSAHPLKW